MRTAECTLITAGFTPRAKCVGIIRALGSWPMTSVDRSLLVGVNGGVIHIEAGIKNAHTGAWESHQSFDVPDLKPDLMVPTHVEFGIKDAKTGKWITHETRDYVRPVPQNTGRTPAPLWKRAFGVLWNE